MTTPRLAFAGTPDFAVPALRGLLNHDRPPAVVLTRPDRPAGRGRRLTPGPVKRLALEAGLPVLQPASLKDETVVETLAGYRPELLVTAAYGLMLPRRVLDLPRLGCWNLHASLLPRWRGASPIQQAILAGDAETGVSLMQMAPGLDTGPVIDVRRCVIDAGTSAADLHDTLAGLAAELLIDALDALASGTLPAPVPQDDSRATYAPRIAKADAELDWTRPARELVAMVHAYNPWPVAHGTVCGLDLRVFDARARAESAPGCRPGDIVHDHLRDDAVRVACGMGCLDILELQAPGRKRVGARDWLNAHPDWR